MNSFNQHDADMLTIGNYITRIMGLNRATNETYNLLAKEYCKAVEMAAVKDDEALHHTMKELLIGNNIFRNLQLLTFILNYKTDDAIITKPLQMYHRPDIINLKGEAVCKASLYKNVKHLDPSKYPFYVTDYSYYCDTFIVIDGLESLSPDGGKVLLERIISNLDAPILIEAGFLHYGDYEIERRDGTDSGILDKLVSYYTSLGFKNVNDVIGNYEKSVVMLRDYNGTLSTKESADGVEKITAFNVAH